MNTITHHAYQSASAFLKQPFHSLHKQERHFFNITSPQVHQGLIASEDKFFASKRDIQELQTRLPDTLCVEMEGAAVAQVCHEYQIPCIIIRTLSDHENEDSPLDFPRFVSSIASFYSLGILKEFLNSLDSCHVFKT